jgi:hypothetical protein
MTLTEAAFWTKRLMVVAGVAAVVFGIIAVILTNANQSVLPVQYLEANYSCTDTAEEFLKYRLEIPSLEVNSGSENVFEVQTDTGRVNDLSTLKIIDVHKYKDKIQQLDNQLKAKEIAAALGFQPDKIYRKGTTDYIWTNGSIGRSLDINARNLNFIMTTNSSYIREKNKEVSLPTENEAISIAKQAIRGLRIVEDDYNYNDPSAIVTHNIDINPDGSFSEALSLSDAELIKVDFHKKKPMITIPSNIANYQVMVNTLNNRIGQGEEEEMLINGQKITVHNYSTVVTYQDPRESNISVYVGPDDKEADVLEEVYIIEFTYWPLETVSCGTYELISPTTALERVQAGEGSLVYLNDKNGDEIEDYQLRTVKKYIIFNIDIAYYEPIGQPTYLQPIYVITGETVFDNDLRGEFHIFYPAINYDLVTDKVVLPEQPTEDPNESPFGI